MPDLPARMFAQESSTLLPTGHTKPMPVMTTRLSAITNLSCLIVSLPNAQKLHPRGTIIPAAKRD